MNQGQGRRMVRRSLEAMAGRMVLVGEAILGLERTMMMRALAQVVRMLRTGIIYPYTGLTKFRGPRKLEAFTI